MEVKEAAVKYQEDGRLYTYADYASWDEDSRCELIDGVIYMMSSPSRRHQGIIVELSYQLTSFLKGKPCKVFIAPFDVCLSTAGDKDRTVVQPDVLVVCDKSKLESKRCNGAPDMVIEVLSPSTASKDKVRKLNKYLEAGVKEYWIVDPADRTVSVCLLESGNYVIKGYTDEGTAPVSILEGCSIDLAEVFAE